METRQIQALLAVADTGSVTKAAQRLHVVQPAISHHLRSLEKAVGATLFERGREGMRLTKSGLILVEHARRAVREIESAMLELKPVPGQVTGQAKLGLLPSSCDLLAGPLVAAVQRDFPGITLSLSVGYTDHLVNLLESGEVDLALLYDPEPSPGLTLQALAQEALVFCAPAHMKLGSRRKLSVKALSAWPLVLPSRPHSLRKLIERLCAAEGVPIILAAETNAASLHKGLVALGFGASVLPRVVIREEIQRGLIVTAPLSDPEFVRTISLALPTSRRTTPAVRSVAAHLKTCMKQAVESGDWFDSRWLAD